MEAPDKANILSRPFYWIISILLVISLFYRLGSWGVIDTSEARYAEISRQMYHNGDYLHPVYMGIEHYHKPPMTYWITSIAYHIFGVSPFSARFFLQIALLVQLILIYRITYLLYPDRSIAISSTLIYASFMLVWVSVRNLTTDAYLNTFLLGATWSILTYLDKNKSIFLYLFALFISLAFLTKITAVFVFMGSLFLFIIWQFREKLKWTWHLVGAAMVALVISGLWFYLLQLEGKSVLKYMLYDQSVVRYTSDTFRRSMPWYFYFMAVSLLTFPWFFLVITNLFRKARLHSHYLIPVFSLCLILPIFFFSLSHSKLLLYILPAIWALAVTGGKLFSAMEQRNIRFWLRIEAVWIILIYTAILTLPFIDSQFNLGSPVLIIIFSFMLVLLTIYRVKWIKPQEKLLTIPLLFTFSIVMASTHFLSRNEENSSTGKIAAEWIKDKGLDDRPVYIYDKLAPSFAFHLSKEIIMIAENEKRELQFENTDQWKNYYYDISDETRQDALLLALKKPSVLIARSNRISKIDPEILNLFSQDYKTGLWTVFY